MISTDSTTAPTLQMMQQMQEQRLADQQKFMMLMLKWKRDRASSCAFMEGVIGVNKGG